jgi:hypothetical protein
MRIPKKVFWRKADIRNAMRRLRVEIENDGISLSSEYAENFGIQLHKVFICPNYSFKTAIKRVNAIIDHARLSDAVAF